MAEGKAQPEIRRRRTDPQELTIRRTWRLLAASFFVLGLLTALRLVAGQPGAIDFVLASVVVLTGLAAVLHRRASGMLEAGRRSEAESFARILQGLSRSISPDAIVAAIVEELGEATGADHIVVVRLRPDARRLEATLVSRRPGVPSSTTELPISDLEDPAAARGPSIRRRRPVAIPIEPGGADRRRATSDRRTARRSGPANARPRDHGPGDGRDDESAARPSDAPGDRRLDRSWRWDLLTPIGESEGADGSDAPVPPSPGWSPGGISEPGSRIAERIAARARAVYGLANTLARPLETEMGVVGAIVLSRRLEGAWPAPAGRILAGAAIEASAALDRAYSHRAAEARASTDALTGLPNRRYFDEFCGLLAHRRRTDDAVGVLMIDIDHFKRLNDSLGHVAGDEVLKAVADAIAGSIRDEDVPARYALIGDAQLTLQALRQAVGERLGGKARGRQIDVAARIEQQRDAWMEQWYEMARWAGAEGGGTAGFGGTGFLFLYCLPERQRKVEEALDTAGLKRVDFRLADEGVSLILDEQTRQPVFHQDAPLVGVRSRRAQH